MSDRDLGTIAVIVLILAATAIIGFGIYTNYDLKRIALTLDCIEKEK